MRWQTVSGGLPQHFTDVVDAEARSMQKQGFPPSSVLYQLQSCHRRKTNQWQQGFLKSTKDVGEM